ncbi:FHA domain-containing protein [Thermacetogenium phaeum DSM 12270]|uniref:FHA domain-containing protein n=1 Tax=Thermacetogenium phaeum (strain ATCC BAA-254 / DSM 26808 / PB) TaxID=1089553 RepID=K4LI45_THEPS|nr:DUF3662 and FHA domain-containing protein [Thermacetogenium phaeum]AFV11635.1 FHA domain-containing protein [Thermacetogenium phaeum DSM 12270]MDN5365156.1 hypothetical protein [Thermacetogenium sp.]
MGLEDLERMISKFWEGIFRKGKRSLQPVEIARALVREMVAQRRVSVSRVYAPNVFTVSLGKDDFVKSAPLQEALSRELADYIKNKAAEKAYTLIGRPQITFTEDDTLESGEIAISSAFAKSEEKASYPLIDSIKAEDEPPDQPAIDQTLIFDKNERKNRNRVRLDLLVVSGPDQGKRINLQGEERFYIGRKGTNHLVLSDINASREHALLEWRGGELYLVDLGSRNGTFINGVRIEQQRLLPGDQFLIGENLLQIEEV